MLDLGEINELCAKTLDVSGVFTWANIRSDNQDLTSQREKPVIESKPSMRLDFRRSNEE